MNIDSQCSVHFKEDVFLYLIPLIHAQCHVCIINSVASVTIFGCSYIYFMQGLEIASECTRKHLRTPKIPKFSWRSMPPQTPLQVLGPEGPPGSQVTPLVPTFFFSLPTALPYDSTSSLFDNFGETFPQRKGSTAMQLE